VERQKTKDIGGETEGKRERDSDRGERHTTKDREVDIGE
jgi:hypothetical protein